MNAPTDDKLRAAYEQQRYVWVRARNHYLMGFVLGLRESLVLIHRFRDFEDTGWVVLRRAAIEYVDSSLDDDGQSLRFFEGMMRREGVLDRVRRPFRISLDSIATAALGAQGENYILLFDRGVHESEEGDFHVGEVLAADDLRIRMRCVTASGRWLAEEHELITAQVEHFEFGSPYLKALQKYSTS